MLVAGADALDPSADAVTLMTLHNAKGLEYRSYSLPAWRTGCFRCPSPSMISKLEERATAVLCWDYPRGRKALTSPTRRCADGMESFCFDKIEIPPRDRRRQSG